MQFVVIPAQAGTDQGHQKFLIAHKGCAIKIL
jgi:hypothetical protein